ncbi:dicarboxylate/amino acid:cation symporter [Methyloversatilis thermotolerans]|uniref:dicarboxylate/amino acid:cation symporter n=1 Tax=Methyloversatilis thermotolerans TaxID=1346290 RepID=UPI000367F0EB|nr:dicarboxylate/amino acid:cation symporter [Methyloversatilis thermotolerans]
MRLSLNTQILIGAIAGVVGGLALGQLDGDSALRAQALYLAGLIGAVFIALLKMVLVPLVFASIVVGVAQLRQHGNIQRVWRITVGFYLFTSLIAVVLGVSAANLFRPGEGLQVDMFADALAGFQAKQMPFPDFVQQFLTGLFRNPFSALANGDIVALVVFALILGAALVKAGERYTVISRAMEEALDLSLLIVNAIMKLAPWGIAALLAKLIATQDVALLETMARFVAVVLGTTLFHGLVVLPGLLWLIARVSPLALWRGGRESFLTALATSSSSATMPITMRITRDHFGVRPATAGFVIPVGTTMNMDGTALYEAAAALFIASLVGIDLSLGQQMLVCGMSMLAAMGAPGIPSAGMVTMVMVLQSVGLPAEAIAILLPIDRLLDAVRTVVNVEGDIIGSIVVDHLAGDDSALNDAQAQANLEARI